MALDHPEDCGCAVCRRHRDRLESDQRFREAQADDTPRPESEHADYEPEPDEPDQVEHTTVVHEHHHHEKRVEQHQHRTTQKTTKPARQPRAKRHSILRFMLVGGVLVWLLHSFYPNLNVPLVPGVACTNSNIQTAGFSAPLPNITPPPGTPGSQIPNPVPKLGDLAKDTVGHAAKKLALLAASTAIHAAGATIRAMATHPPAVADIRDGLHHDIETVGRVIGFVTAAFGGASPAALTDANTQTETIAAAASSCGACPTQTLPATAGSGILTAARAALRAGFRGDDAVTAVAIAGAESTYNRLAVNANSTARGMWQIMLSYHQPKFHGADWRNPYANAQVAHQLWLASGWQPWTTHTSGAYRAHLNEARAAVAKVSGGGAGGVVTAADVRPVACDTGTRSVSTAGPTVNGLRPVARAAEGFVRSHFGFRGTIGGYSYRNIAGTSTLSQHAKGLAIDVMIPLGPESDAIFNYFAGPGFGRFHVANVIHNRMIYNAGRGLHPYTGVNPHTDHVHIDFQE
jgi:hypothetical protein